MAKLSVHVVPSATSRRWPGAARALPLLWLVAVGACTAMDEAGGDGQPKAKSYTKTELTWLYDKGQRALERGYPEVARGHFQEVSDAGYAAGSAALGKLYATGYPELTQDYATAAAYYHKAVDEGAGYLAELPLGYLYLNGLGVQPDRLEAEHWFRRGAVVIADLPAPSQGSAEQPDGAAQLVARLFEPHEVPGEFDAAMDWARGLESWDAERLYKESIAYRGGTERLQDVKLADTLRDRAAGKDHPRAAYEAGMARLSGSPDRRDQAGAVELLWRAARGDHVPAQMELGLRYAAVSGDGWEQQKAYYWLRRARDGGANVTEALSELESDMSTEDKLQVTANLESDWTYPP